MKITQDDIENLECQLIIMDEVLKSMSEDDPNLDLVKLVCMRLNRSLLGIKGYE